ncbi:MAG: M48 family metallopeptidase [Shimia sp.]
MVWITPILLALGYGVAMYFMSSWQTRRMLDAQSTPLRDVGLDPVLGKLARALDVPRLRVNVHEVPQINGLAAPDGRIFLTRGFLDRYRAGEVSAEELASVIAHELGHVALGHTRRRMVDFSTANALRAGLSLVLARVIPIVGPMIANAIAGLLTAGLSRSDEYEADEYASALMLKAGLGTAPQISLFRKLERLTKMRTGAGPAWFMSHPKPTERIAAIEANTAKWLRR